MGIIASHKNGPYLTTRISWSIQSNKGLLPLLTCFCHVLRCGLPLGFHMDGTSIESTHIATMTILGCTQFLSGMLMTLTTYRFTFFLLFSSWEHRHCCSSKLFLMAISSMQKNQEVRTDDWLTDFFVARTSFLNPRLCCLKLVCLSSKGKK